MNSAREPCPQAYYSEFAAACSTPRSVRVFRARRSLATNWRTLGPSRRCYLHPLIRRLIVLANRWSPCTSLGRQSKVTSAGRVRSAPDIPQAMALRSFWNASTAQRTEHEPIHSKMISSTASLLIILFALPDRAGVRFCLQRHHSNAVRHVLSQI